MDDQLKTLREFPPGSIIVVESCVDYTDDKQYSTSVAEFREHFFLRHVLSTTFVGVVVGETVMKKGNNEHRLTLIIDPTGTEYFFGSYAYVKRVVWSP